MSAANISTHERLHNHMAHLVSTPASNVKPGDLIVSDYNCVYVVNGIRKWKVVGEEALVVKSLEFYCSNRKNKGVKTFTQGMHFRDRVSLLVD